MKLQYIATVALVSLYLLVGCKEETSVAKVEESNKTTLDLITEEIQKDPTNHNLLYKRAQIYFAKEQYDFTITDLRDAILLDSLQFKYYHLLADAFMDTANSNRSIMAMEKVVELFPSNTLSKLKLAENYFITTQHQESVVILNRILQTDPNNAEAYFMLGMNFRANGEEKQAINSFQKATELDPNIIDAWVILGNIFDEKGQKIASKYFDSAIRIAPDNISALHAKAFYLQNNDDVSGALALYKKINRIDRNYGGAYLNAGILYNELDSLDQAYEQFNILATIEPSSSDSYYYRAFVAYRKGQIEDAKRDIQNCLNINPENQRAKELLTLIEK